MTFTNEKPSNKESLPRPSSVLYKLNHPNEEIKKKTLKKFRRLNKYLVLPLYRLRLLPILGFGRIFLILTTIGRKTGKKRRTPLEYHWIDDVITIFSGRGEDSGWLKNIRQNPESVWVRHGFHSFHAKLEFVSKEPEKLKIIRWYVVKHGRSAKLLFGWDPNRDDPNSTDFSNLINMFVIIRLFPKD
jgi:deazaflavin-dependent oxidoreductase (nitroreductase family)